MRRICSTTLRILALVAAVLSGGLASPAQADLLTPVSVVVRSYEALTDWDHRALWPCCLQRRFEAEGMRYVEIGVRLDVPWSDDLTSVRVTEKDILVELPDGSTLETFGRMTYAGRFRTSQPRLWAIKPKNWPEQDSDAYVAPVFQIPEEITSVVLKIGDLFETVIEIPEPTDMDHPADFARFEILGHRRFDGFKRDGSGTHIQRSWELVLPDGFT